MMLSDHSVRRPVFAAVISMLLIILGLASMLRLPVRQYPDINPPVVSVETRYRGASAEVVETKVTQVLEDSIAGIEGVAKLTSQSRDERSDIRVEFILSRDIDAAANDIRDRVSRVLDQLPIEAEPPEIAKVDNTTRAVMYLNLTSDRMDGLELTDYADRFLVDRLSTVPGVARVSISGARRYAMRIWLSREALAARQLTVSDVEARLRSENVELPAGRLESVAREFTLRTDTGFYTEKDFRGLVIGRGVDGQLVRLGDVAEVRVGAENERSIARANGEPAVSLAIEQLSKANSVLVSKAVVREVRAVQPELPEGMQLAVNYDRAEFIEASMNEVYKALAVALGLVLVVIYVFLGSFRSTLIPALVVPVSVIATFIVMGAMGYTINVLTLLGLVLAIGLVVDDAIVVLENIYRRIEEGEKPLLAALDGAREIGFAVIATTLVLVAVFVPLSYIEGDVGRLFREFGITLAAAVLFSSVVALTLTPMLCSKMLRGRELRTGLPVVVDRFFKWLVGRYQQALDYVLRWPWAVLATVLVITAVAGLLLYRMPAEYAPNEDRGAFFVMVRAPEGASLEYTDRVTRQLEAVLQSELGEGRPVHRFLTRLPGWGSSSVNSSFVIVLLRNWDDRAESDQQIIARLGPAMGEIPGARIFARAPRALGIRGDGSPVEMVLGGPDYEQLKLWRDQMLEAMEAMPELTSPDSDYQERKPQMNISVDRDRAASLGVSLSSIGRTLETMLGSRVVTNYVDRGREYDVILQGIDADRSSPDDLENLYVRSELTGQMVPLVNLVVLSEQAGPPELRRFDRMRSITLSASLAEGVRLGEAIEALYQTALDTLPASARISWDGESQEYLESGSSLYLTFGLALIIVFLVLAAQFESFINPLIILVTVPLALTGALLGLLVYGSSINVFTQIGAILLIGLAAKNGVLIVEFANQLRDRGVRFREAVLQAASVRLRPILMTSACTTFGALPLLIGTGAGAESRQPIGIVVVYGVAISAALTLFVVPALYVLFARTTSSPQAVSRMIDRLRETTVRSRSAQAEEA
ncbi:MAG: MMPL family transporter [Xanthomonadales bacterium]|nr:MMPL family transporter [Xanthomonadales bacterium]NIN59696.1 MMPL family transporter [Xanthomonadales bacterium]NIN75109.1 MMPL family transporter [Xanthomonadales bacterium]NIO15083.1 MMPL family transporter [Xanthomonadales bacterium]NIP12089.1 MMPL family transporter [Xanthomonadales bacterium]